MAEQKRRIKEKKPSSGIKNTQKKPSSGIKKVWKPANMVYPAPAAMVSVADGEGNTDIITVAWTGNICSDPPMAYVSVRRSRHSFAMIEKSGEFVINLTTKALAKATDYCGVRSGRDVDKWKEMKLTKQAADKVQAPLIAESPVNIECKVVNQMDLGSHVMFIGAVEAVHVDEAFLDEKGRFDLTGSGLIAYAHGEYIELGKTLGTFGFSVRKKPVEKTKARPAPKPAEKAKARPATKPVEQIKKKETGRRKPR